MFIFFFVFNVQKLNNLFGTYEWAFICYWSRNKKHVNWMRAQKHPPTIKLVIFTMWQIIDDDNSKLNLDWIFANVYLVLRQNTNKKFVAICSQPKWWSSINLLFCYNLWTKPPIINLFIIDYFLFVLCDNKNDVRNLYFTSYDSSMSNRMADCIENLCSCLFHATDKKICIY